MSVTNIPEKHIETFSVPEVPFPVLIASSIGKILAQNKACSLLHSLSLNDETVSLQYIVQELISIFSEKPFATLETIAGEKVYLFSISASQNIYTIWATDITKVADERDFYKEVLDNLPADIGTFSTDCRYLYVNPRGIKDAKLRKWIIGKTDFEYCAYRNKSTEMAEKRREQISAVVETKKEYGYEEEVITPSGEKVYHVRKQSPVLDEDGNVKFIIGYGIDITDRKRAEQQLAISEKRFRQIFDHSLALICIHSTDGKIIDVNPALCKLMEYNSEEIAGKPLSGYIDPSVRKLFDSEYLEPINTKAEAKGIFSVITKSGNKKYLLYHNYLVKEEGADPFIIGFAQDITEIKKAEFAQKEATKTIELSAKAKEQFVATMSHEIRTPMNAIIGMTHQLRKTSLNNTQEKYLDAIVTASKHLMVIINDILDFSKIEAGKLQLENIGFRMDEVVNSVKAVTDPLAEEKKLKVDFTVDKNIAPVLVGDPYRINQILINLLSNAIKFTEDGNVTAHISLANEDEKTQTLQFIVSDTGIGMSEDFMHNLFAMYAQEDASVTRQYGGSGLGLRITRQLVEMMHGTIEAESKKNNGSTFTVTLTFEKGVVQQVSKQLDQDEIAANALEGRVILLADDNELNVLVGSTVLKNYGATIITAKDGKEVIEAILQNSSIEVVLMDIEMPGINGLDATSIIRNEIGLAVPIIAVTANVIKSDVERFLAAGMNDFVGKPFSEVELVGTVLKWIDPCCL